MEPGGRHLGQLGRMLQADTGDASVATTITIGIDYMHNQNATRTQTYKIGIARDSVGVLTESIPCNRVGCLEIEQFVETVKGFTASCVYG